MQAKNFGPERLSLHPNRGYGTPKSALGKSSSSRPMSHKIKLKETDRKNRRVSHNVRNQESRKAVPADSTRVRGEAVPKPETRHIGLVSAAERNAILQRSRGTFEEINNNRQVYK